MVRPRVAIWTLVALVAGAVALAPLHGGIKTADAAAIAFETPTIVDPIHTNGEPDIAIDPQGRVFNSGPTGTGTQRSTWFGSVDGGHTFRVMTQKIPASPATGIPAPGPGGGDTDIAFDRSGKQYFADLWALACQRVAGTGPTNPGATDQANFLCCAGSKDLKKLAHIADPPTGSPDTLFSVLSMDSARTLEVVWTVSPANNDPPLRQTFVSASSAASGWTVWTAPVQVSDGSTATGDATNVFPWVKAGGPGRADAVWYGSNLQVDPSSHNNQAWNVFMSQVVFPTSASGAVTGAAPSRQLVKVTPHPMHFDD